MKRFFAAALALCLLLAAPCALAEEFDPRRLVIDEEWELYVPYGLLGFDGTDKRVVMYDYDQGTVRYSAEKDEFGTHLWLQPDSDEFIYEIEILIFSEEGFGDLATDGDEMAERLRDTMYDYYSSDEYLLGGQYAENIKSGIEYLTPERPWAYYKMTSNDGAGTLQENLYYETFLQDYYVAVALYAVDEEIQAEQWDVVREIAGSIRYLPTEGPGAAVELAEDDGPQQEPGAAMEAEVDDGLRQGLNAFMWVMLGLLAAVILGIVVLVYVSRRKGAESAEAAADTIGETAPAIEEQSETKGDIP